MTERDGGLARKSFGNSLPPYPNRSNSRPSLTKQTGYNKRNKILSTHKFANIKAAVTKPLMTKSRYKRFLILYVGLFENSSPRFYSYVAF